MREDDSPNLVDWIVISIRWLYILGLTLSLFRGSILSTSVYIALLVILIWNISLSITVILNRRMRGYRYLSVAFDFFIAGFIYFVSSELGESILWVGLMPISSAALYFQLSGALLTALALLLVQGFLALVLIDPENLLFQFSILILINSVYALALGFLSKRLWIKLRNLEDIEHESEQAARQAERKRNQTIYNIISTMNASLNYQRVLDSALDLAYSTFASVEASGERMVSAVMLFTDNENHKPVLQVGSARRFTPADMRITLPGTEGLIGRTIDQGEARLTSKVANDLELARFISLRQCRTAYFIPLRTGLETYGILLYAHPEDGYFSKERREILDIIGKQSVVAIQNAILYRDLEKEKERIVEVQEEARKKLARDLHDGPTQSVAALAMRVNYVRRLIHEDVDAAIGELVRIEDLARRTTKEIRHMLFTLRPLVLESQGLIAALESMSDKMHETYDQDMIIEADSEIISQLELGKQGVIFYIAEEAVNNARKHAQAKHIWLRLRAGNDELAILEIEDDGVGFDLNILSQGYESRGSLGMVNLQERTEMVNGALEIESAEGQGTKITIIIPLSKEAAERIRRGS